MTSIIEQLNQRNKSNHTIPPFRSGDTIIVKRKIREGERERLQTFEGLVIARHRTDSINATATVRKTAYGVSVEYIIPLHSPLTESIQVKRRGRVRRSKLYYIRELSGKKARIKEKLPEKSSKKAKKAQQAKAAEAIKAKAQATDAKATTKPLSKPTEGENS